MRAGEDPAGQAFPLANEAQEQMLGLDRDAAELAGLVAGEEKDSPGPFGIAFEHPIYLHENRWCWGHETDDHIIRHTCFSRPFVSSDNSLSALGFTPHPIRRLVCNGSAE